MGMTEDASMKMHRCVCGEVFDLIKQEKCPECGAAGVSSGSREQTLAQALEASPDISHSPQAAQRDWKKISMAFAAVFLVYLMLRSGSDKTVGDTAQSAGTQGEAVAHLDMSDSPMGKFGSDAFERVDAKVSDGVVDPKLVGTWQQTVRTMNGEEIWQIDVRSDGTYAFKTSGGMASVQHAGEFSAQNGKWKLRSTNTGWKDGGSYSVPRSNLFVMMGALGTGQWGKVK